MVENGQEKWIDAATAEADGYTLVDLSDDWTPFIFAEQQDATGEPLPNRYRRVFIGLANDQLDEDGQPLRARARRTTSSCTASSRRCRCCARASWTTAGATCLDETARAALEAVETVSYIAPTAVRREEVRIARLRTELEAARRKAQVEDAGRAGGEAARRWPPR